MSSSSDMVDSVKQRKFPGPQIPSGGMRAEMDTDELGPYSATNGGAVAVTDGPLRIMLSILEFVGSEIM